MNTDNIKLQQAIASAESVPVERRDVLADAIVTLVATYTNDGSELSREHQAEIARRFSEPFVPADTHEVEALFARHGA